MRGEIYDDRFDADEDRRLDARMEEYDRTHPPNMECEECGFEWYSRIRRSRDCPPEPVEPDCPRCNA